MIANHPRKHPPPRDGTCRLSRNSLCPARTPADWMTVDWPPTPKPDRAHLVSYAAVVGSSTPYLERGTTRLGCPRKLGIQWWSDQLVISPTYGWSIFGGYDPLILTIDPNFLRYPSTSGYIQYITFSVGLTRCNPIFRRQLIGVIRLYTPFVTFFLEVTWLGSPPCITVWWFQPLWKILVKLEIFPK